MSVLPIRVSKFGIFHKVLAAMFIAAALPLGAIWYVNYQNNLGYITRAVDQQLSGLSDKLVTHVDDWVAMHSHLLRQNAALKDMVSMDQRAQTPILRGLLREYQWSYLVFTIAPDGRNIARSDDKPLIDYSERVYFRQVMDGAPLGKQVVVSKTTGKPSLILSVPILGAENAIVGVLAMGVSLTDLSTSITNARIGQTGYAFLLDDAGTVVAHQKQNFATEGANFSGHPAALTQSGESKKHVVFEEDGHRVVAYAQRTHEGWTMVAQQNYDEAFAALSDANRNALVLLLISLAAAAGLAFALSQRLSRPIRNLTAAAEEISRGRFNTPVPETARHDEIGALAAALDRMSVSIRLALERLKMRA